MKQSDWEKMGGGQLLKERNRWRKQFEAGKPLESPWLDTYRERRNDELWRSTRALEKLCEYVLYLEAKIKSQEKPLSLDLYLTRPTCPTCGQEPDELYFNCTYNLAPMWYKIYPEDENFVPIEGMKGRDAEAKIMDALILLEDYKEAFQKLNPPDGWGTYEDFVEFLNGVHKACIDFPELIWKADR